MALFRPGFLGTVSGKLGGLEFSSGRASSYVRRGKLTCNRQSRAQLEQRAAMAFQLAFWQAYNPWDRWAWNTFAAAVTKTNRLGVRRPISGYQSFMTFAPLSWHMQANSCPVPPALPTCNSPFAMSLDFQTTPDYSISYDGFQPGTAPHARFWGARHLSVSLDTQPRVWTLLDWNDLGSSPADLTNMFITALGEPPVGEIVGIRVIWYSELAMHSPPSWTITTVY